jgi:hypothetical protein
LNDVERVNRCVAAVNFAVDPGGATSALMRGQEYYWYFYYAVPEHKGILLTWAWQIPSGATAQTVGAALDRLVRRHEALRTDYPISERGLPLQRIHAPDRIPILIWPDHTGTGVDEVARELTRIPIDPAVDRPIRVGVVVADHTPTWVVLAFNHVTLDGASFHLLRDDFVAGVVELGDSSLPAGRQPSAQAAFENTENEQRFHAKTLSYWDRCLEAIPIMMFPSYRKSRRADGTAEDSTPFTAATLSLPGISAAAELVAKAHRMSAPAVFLAAYAVVVAAVSGQYRCGLYVASANRFDPAVASSVGCFFQPGVAVIELSRETSMSDALRECHRAALRSLQYSRYSYWRMRETMARKARERGAMIRIGVHFNFLPRQNPPEHGNGGAGLSPANADVAWEYGVDWEDYDTDLYFRVDPDEDTLFLLAHDSTLDRGLLEQSLRAIAELVVMLAESAAHHNSDLASVSGELGIPVPAYSPGWAYVDHSWIKASELLDLLRSIPLVDAAAVFVVPAEDGERRLLAYVSSQASRIVPSYLRLRLLAGLPHHPNVMVPHWFVVCTEAPEGDREEDWRRARVVSEGSGHDAPEIVPSTAEERHLYDAIEIFNPGISRDAARSYVLCGGAAAVTPAIVGELARKGYFGILPDDLLGPQPLFAVAEMLHRGTAPSGAPA